MIFLLFLITTVSKVIFEMQSFDLSVLSNDITSLNIVPDPDEEMNAFLRRHKLHCIWSVLYLHGFDSLEVIVIMIDE